MASNKVNVFVKLDMDGKGSKAFNVERSTTIKDLKQMVEDREGVAVDTMVYRTKPLQDKNTLADYDFQNNGTIIAAMRLIGGAAMAEGSSATQFNKYKVEALASKYGASVVTTKCEGWYGYDGCNESMINKCKFACGCTHCPDCMREIINSQLGHSGAIFVTCGNSGHANKTPALVIPTQLAYIVAAFDETKINEKDWIIEQNYANKPTAYMRPCYGCKKFMVRKKNDATYVEECPGCHKFMCWACGEAKHDKPSDCSAVKNKQALIDGIGDQAKEKDVYGKQCWPRRVCINRECRKVRSHAEACNHITCPCGQQYCHWCLQDWKGHSSSSCAVKPKENVTAKYLWG